MVVVVVATTVGNITLHSTAFTGLATTKVVLHHHLVDLHAKLRTGFTPLQVAQMLEHGSAVDLLSDALQRKKRR
jgi:hypothetical protein